VDDDQEAVLPGDGKRPAIAGQPSKLAALEMRWKCGRRMLVAAHGDGIEVPTKALIADARGVLASRSAG
jgi:hypothetical protein